MSQVSNKNLMNLTSLGTLATADKVDKIMDNEDSKTDNDSTISKSKNGRTEVWTEKYRPEKIEDLVGSNLQIDEIEAWFKAYKNKDPNIKRALLLSGPPGLGKTTLAHAVLLKHGYKIKEYNASDVRSKKLVHKNLFHIINTGSVDKASPDYKSFGIIMDEVDGMSSGDMGGMAELISFINPTRGKRSVKKEEKTALAQRWIPPIICICNDNTDKKMKELKKDCQEIVFKKPTKKELRTVIDRVSAIEKFTITEEAADLVCGQAQGDYRRLLTILQNLCTMASLNTSYSSDERHHQHKLIPQKENGELGESGKDQLVEIDANLVTDQNSIFCSKDLDLHLTEKVNGLFNQASKPDQLLKIYETEKSLLPMMMHENYLDFIPLQIGISDFEKLSNIRETIDSIVLGDIIDKTMYNNQSWHLQEIHGLSSSWVPCFYVNRNKKSAYKKVSFTTALGRFSFQRANQKNINGLVRKINRDDTYSLEDVRALSEIILYNLLEPNGTQELGIQYLIEYNLHINDVKDLIKMNKLEDHYAVLHTSRMKTALLKLYTNHIKKLEDQDKPKEISQQFLRNLLVRNERTGIDASESETDLQNLKIKGTDTVLRLSDTSGSDNISITPTLVQKPKTEEVTKIKPEKEIIPKPVKTPKAKAVKAPKAPKVPKTPKAKAIPKGKTQSSIAKALSVTAVPSGVTLPGLRLPQTEEVKTNSTQTVVKLNDSRLKLPPLIVQKPNVTVTIVPGNKVSIPASANPILTHTQTSITSSISNTPVISNTPAISNTQPAVLENSSMATNASLPTILKTSNVVNANISGPVVEGKKIQLRILPKIVIKK